MVVSPAAVTATFEIIHCETALSNNDKEVAVDPTRKEIAVTKQGVVLTDVAVPTANTPDDFDRDSYAIVLILKIRRYGFLL